MVPESSRSKENSVEQGIVIMRLRKMPVICFPSDFWGCLKLPKNNPIENLHMMMCKQVLGVQKQTTNIGVLLELGRILLGIWALKFAVKNWERIRLGHGRESRESKVDCGVPCPMICCAVC